MEGTLCTLNNRVQKMPQEVKRVMGEVFTTGLLACSLPTGDTPSIQQPDNEQPAEAGPDSQQPGPSGEKRRTPDVDTPSRCSKKQRATLVTTLDKLPGNTQEQLRPFFNKDVSRMKKDLLNSVQRAFVKAKANELLVTGATLSGTFAELAIQEGISLRIWHEDFSPSLSDKSFHDYLHQRLKNERKSQRKKSLIQSQEAMVNEYVAIICVDEERLDSGEGLDSSADSGD